MTAEEDRLHQIATRLGKISMTLTKFDEKSKASTLTGDDYVQRAHLLFERKTLLEEANKITDSLESYKKNIEKVKEMYGRG